MATVRAVANLGQELDYFENTKSLLAQTAGARAYMWIRDKELYTASTTPSVADYGIQFMMEGLVFRYPTAIQEQFPNLHYYHNAAMIGMGGAVRVQDENNYYAGFAYNHYRGPLCDQASGGNGWYLVKVLNGAMTVLDFVQFSFSVDYREDGGWPWDCEVRARGSTIEMKVRNIKSSHANDQDLSAVDGTISGIGKPGILFIKFNHNQNYPYNLVSNPF